jgi:hypothetical protein
VYSGDCGPLLTKNPRFADNVSKQEVGAKPSQPRRPQEAAQHCGQSTPKVCGKPCNRLRNQVQVKLLLARIPPRSTSTMFPNPGDAKMANLISQRMESLISMNAYYKMRES